MHQFHTCRNIFTALLIFGVLAGGFRIAHSLSLGCDNIGCLASVVLYEQDFSHSISTPASIANAAIPPARSLDLSYGDAVTIAGIYLLFVSVVILLFLEMMELAYLRAMKRRHHHAR